MEECKGEEGEGGHSDIMGRDDPSQRGAAALLEASEGRYVPPHLRKAATGDSKEKKARQLEKLRKKVQGLVNRCVVILSLVFVDKCVQAGLTQLICHITIFSVRLSESNMQSISSQLEQLYFENSRNGEKKAK